MRIGKDKSWIERTNLYEVNLRQYTQEGTFAAFAKSLPRLKDMGVETLWFMPITPIAQKNKKGSLGSYYACSDYTSVNPEFGTLDQWKALVKEAQGMGLKVILDWVANHTGWDHKWTLEHPDYYKREADGSFKVASGMDDIIELDFSNPALRKEMIDAMKFWVTETGIDGFRCDLGFWVQLDFWVEAKAELDKIAPLFWLAELEPLDHLDYMQVFDAAYTWKWMHDAQEFYGKRATLSQLRQLLLRYNQLAGMRTWFTTNHDENSWNGTEFEKYGDAAKALAVFTCTYPGLPLIYSGQELPNRKRLEFFDKDVIEWTSEYALHSFYKTLLEFRKRNASLSAQASVQFLETEASEEILAYQCKTGAQQVVVLLNLSANPLHFEILDHSLTGVFRNVFTGAERDLSKAKNMALNPWEFFVFESI